MQGRAAPLHNGWSIYDMVTCIFLFFFFFQIQGRICFPPPPWKGSGWLTKNFTLLLECSLARSGRRGFRAATDYYAEPDCTGLSLQYGSVIFRGRGAGAPRVTGLRRTCSQTRRRGQRSAADGEGW